MAKPRIFVSSTYYDLKHIRANLERFIESLGYEPILFEKGGIAYSPEQPLDESCYREVGNSDIFVLILGGRYGSEKSSTSKKSTREFYERYDSITKQEYQNAVSKDIPVYILVEKGVYADYETYLQNRENTKINYVHVDSVNIFRLIEFILKQPKNNPVQYFDHYSEIESWLRDQWAGLFRDLLNRLSSQKQISSLSNQVAELSEVNKTLKKYLEEVVTKVSPDSSKELIQLERDRLEEFYKLSVINSNPMLEDMHYMGGIPKDILFRLLRESKTVLEFMERATENLPPTVKDKNRYNIDLMDWNLNTNFLNSARESIGLKPWPAYKPRRKK